MTRRRRRRRRTQAIAKRYAFHANAIMIKSIGFFTGFLRLVPSCVQYC